MAEVFISHVEEDETIAFRISEALNNANISSWFYERDSLPGLSYLEQVYTQIQQSKVIIIIISIDSLSSNQVTNELTTSYELGKAVVPILSGLKHSEFQTRQPIWRQAIGTATSIAIPLEGIDSIIGRIIEGVRMVLGKDELNPLCFKNELARESASNPQLAQSSLKLYVQIDRASPLTKVVYGRSKLYGTITLSDGTVAYGEGVILRLTLQNPCDFSVIVRTLDLRITKHEPYPVDAPVYNEFETPGTHMEMPSSILSLPIELSEIHVEGTEIQVLPGRLLLEQKGTVGSCHTLNFRIVAQISGLWELQVVAEVSDLESKKTANAISEAIQIIKR